MRHSFIHAIPQQASRYRRWNPRQCRRVQGDPAALADLYIEHWTHCGSFSGVDEW